MQLPSSMPHPRLVKLSKKGASWMPPGANGEPVYAVGDEYVFLGALVPMPTQGVFASVSTGLVHVLPFDYFDA